MGTRSNPEPLLTPAEVAGLFRVDAKSVTKWAAAGKLRAIRTLGGHRRFRESEVLALLDGAPIAPVELMPQSDGGVTAVRNGVAIGSAWSNGRGWFARRVDRKGGAETVHPDRAAALEYLKGGEPDA
jgi:excisionase family DNA binding protein